MKRIVLDFETRGSIDLKKCGAYRYAADPGTSILCLGYSVDGAAPVVLTAAQIANGEFFNFAADISKDVVFVAHNFQFETAIWESVMHKRFGYPALSDARRWSCTLSRSAMCNLPLSLAECGAALGVGHKKDLTGRGVMLKLSRPIDTDPISGEPVYNNDAALFETLHSYCAADVAAEVELDKKLPELPPSERLIFELDAKINFRGVQMDVDLARKATALASTLTTELNEKLTAITGGAVIKASRIAEMKRWLLTQKVTTPDGFDKEAVAGLLARADISQKVKDVLTIRRQVGKTSTSKYNAILKVADPHDQRARGLLQYHGASTGRWAGRLIQPHNFPKGVTEGEQWVSVNAVMAGSGETFSRLYGAGAMDALSGALRGAVIAAPGKCLIVADYSTIEPRVLFWLAEDTRALAAYREGADLYVDLARLIYGNPALTKKDSKERAVGKMGVLGCGYGMGKDRFQAQCAAVQPVPVHISLELAARAVRAYRDRYSKVVRMWYAIDAAARKAVREPGVVAPCCGGRVHWGMDMKREFLVCRLPSGRFLRYYRPSIKGGEYGEEIHYQGPGLGGALEDFKTYGGSLTENIVQAIARDIMAAAMLRLEHVGYPIVLTVHDEIISEIAQLRHFEDEPDPRLPDFIEIMCITPSWATGCPITAEGYVSERYRK